MSDEGDKTCPLCAEEMDLTDQQLKPCKCGYEICVWCWHHIMDMAEKDETEGRCPACRTPYNKEKIVGTASRSCGRLVPEMHGEKKKAAKGRNKNSEGRKQLASVRVIQRNLVYVVGLPLNFADEDLLERKEYFGQYGKVLKVSVSRTTTGAIQHFANNTCSVYITYLKEEDSVRCIQSVHGFVLDGRPLKACFGTTKYCHAWLRNMPCNNPDCLYLHEIGSQEDSFTKDEIISAYTRDRVQQTTGLSNSTQRRSGDVLPPPADEYRNSTTSGNPISKSGVNTKNSAINARVSPPNSSCGGSSALPAGASWGARASNTQQPLLENTQCSNDPVKQKLDAYNGSGAHSTGKMLVHGEMCSVQQTKSKIGTFEHWKKESDADMKINGSGSSLGSAHSFTLPLNTHDQQATKLPWNSNNIVDSPTPNGQVAGPTAAVGQRQFPSPRSDTVPNEESNISRDTSKAETSEPWIKESDTDKRNNISESAFEFVQSAALPLNRQTLGQPVTNLPHYKTNIVDPSIMAGMASNKEAGDAPGGNIENLCSDILSMSITENQILETGSGLHVRETVALRSTGATEMSSAEVGLIDVQPDFSLGIPTQVTQVALPVLEDDLLSFEKQRANDPEFTAIGKPDFVHMSDLSMHSNFFSSQFNNAESSVSVGLDTHVIDRIDNLINTTSNISSGYPQTIHGIPEVNDEYASLVPNKEKRLLTGRFAGEVVHGAFDTGEGSIISNILSMDFDSLDEPLTSSQNLAKLLGETDKRRRHPGLSGSLRIHGSNQSRFSFAREDELFSQRSDQANSVGFLDHGFKPHALGRDFSIRNGLQIEKHGSYTNFPITNGTGLDTSYHIHSNLSSNRLSGAGSRSQVSAPPGFSGQNRAPPGFASHDRREQSLDTVSGNHMLEGSSFLRNQYQAPPIGNDTASNDDVELIDPAILAVGKGMLPSGISNPGLDLGPNYSSQFSTYEGARLQSLLQGSFPQHLNQRFRDFGGSNSSITDPYRSPLCNSSFSDPYRVPSDSYASLDNPYRISSRVVDQTLTSSLSPFSQFTHPPSTSGVTSNGQRDAWNEIHSGNNLGIAEQLRAEKLGFNKFYGGYEDSKIRMPSSGNLYDRTYGI